MQAKSFTYSMDKPLLPQWTGTASSVDQKRIFFGLREDDMKGEVINKYVTLGIVTALDSAT